MEGKGGAGVLESGEKSREQRRRRQEEEVEGNGAEPACSVALIRACSVPLLEKPHGGSHHRTGSFWVLSHSFPSLPKPKRLPTFRRTHKEKWSQYVLSMEIGWVALLPGWYMMDHPASCFL